MAEFRLSPAAQDDLEAVFEYTLREWGLDQALRYTDLIEQNCAELAEGPLLAQSCDAIRPGYRRRTVGRHVIYFKQAEYGIAVIRILHQRMDTARHL
jgi:toxin ParE1/3/4